MKYERTKKIEEYILEKKSVKMDKLCEVFNVSPNTIRRDIKEILKKGTIEKVYGGVTAASNETLVSFKERKIINQNLKSKIALKASEFVNDNDIIYVDSGTTTVHMVDGLKNKSVTVFTNNLNFIIQALPYANIKIIALSGSLDRAVNSFVGQESIDFLKNLNIQKAFMATTGVAMNIGITNASIKESGVKETAINQSSEIFLLMDSSKFSSLGLVTYAQFSDIDFLLTDFAPKEYVDFLKEKNIKLEIC
ncbi:DeoR/GlpR family DNA-binding transcription regulator [Fusobacterium sp. IOR10]|uniref:DeoR/GlpR family DNA-binding transcription regulator n=1 Tax=Fusobacterium sp. IOR10 TaxID=2665157 RepID=UPI0013D39464|nr:DeoR/GlpR family DNA-binding transcription regulator [Fusobacterium sp. IOR10]